MVRVDLRWTYGVTVDGKTVYYGPGVVPVPEDVARRQGWRPVTEPGLTNIPGVGPDLAHDLEAAGLETVADVAGADLAALTAVPGIGPVSAAKIQAAAKELSGGDSD